MPSRQGIIEEVKSKILILNPLRVLIRIPMRFFPFRMIIIKTRFNHFQSHFMGLLRKY